MDTAKLEGIVARLLTEGLEAAVAKLKGYEGKAGSVERAPPAADATPEASLPPSVAAFDELVDDAVKRLVTAAEKLGGKVQESTAVLESAFKAERNIVLAIAQCKKPDNSELQKLLTPVGELIGKADHLTGGKKTEVFHNVKAVAESLQTLTWVAYTGKDCGMSLPAPHVEECWAAAEFYSNKVLVEHKSKNPDQVEWARALKELYVPKLRDYVKKYHTTGPAWNPKGIELSKFDPSSAAGPSPPPAAPAGSAPPTPPPPPPATPSRPPGPPPPPGAPPPPPNFGGLAGAPASPAADMSQVFSAINKGESVTSGLRKVTPEMKTKNRTDKTGSVPASSPSPAAAPSATPASKAEATPAKTAPPLFELQQGRKWVVENMVGKKDIVIEETEPKQTVYIYGCKNAVIRVKGKVNSIALDKCTKTGLVFQDVVASCEVVNCFSVEVQCEGSAPTVLIDNTSGCQLYLSKESVQSSITTAKSSEVNVLVPGEKEDDDPIEHAIPEQFTHEFKDGHFITTPVSHSGG